MICVFSVNEMLIQAWCPWGCSPGRQHQTYYEDVITTIICTVYLYTLKIVDYAKVLTCSIIEIIRVLRRWESTCVLLPVRAPSPVFKERFLFPPHYMTYDLFESTAMTLGWVLSWGLLAGRERVGETACWLKLVSLCKRLTVITLKPAILGIKSLKRNLETTVTPTN